MFASSSAVIVLGIAPDAARLCATRADDNTLHTRLTLNPGEALVLVYLLGDSGQEAGRKRKEEVKLCWS